MDCKHCEVAASHAIGGLARCDEQPHDGLANIANYPYVYDSHSRISTITRNGTTVSYVYRSSAATKVAIENGVGRFAG